MKWMLMAVAAGLTASAGPVRADWGGPTPIPVGPQGMVIPSGATPGEFSSPGTLMGLGAPTPGKAPDRYGLLPSLRRTFHKKDGCDTCGDGAGGLGHGKAGKGKGGCGPFGHGGYGGAGYGAPAYQPMMQGTLVFPHHTFVRSPRDFFMSEPGR